MMRSKKFILLRFIKCILRFVPQNSPFCYRFDTLTSVTDLTLWLQLFGNCYRRIHFHSQKKSRLSKQGIKALWLVSVTTTIINFFKTVLYEYWLLKPINSSCSLEAPQFKKHCISLRKITWYFLLAML